MKTIALFLLLGVPFFVNAQIKVWGVVRDENAEVIKGVSITAKKFKSTVMTDNDGKFELSVFSGDTLLLSHTSYKEDAVVVVKGGPLNIVMIKKVSQLDNVVVIGYGTVNKRDLTGSVGEVNINDIAKAPVPSFDQALAGRVAGVSVNSSDGQPGAAIDITIRGGNSLTQSNAPLYVVDGFPMTDFNANSINPGDIETISILKDASATAIYGSRGANGVIIIETKKGKAGKAEISYSGYVGVQSITKTMDLMDPYEFVKYQVALSPEGATEMYLNRPEMTLDDYKSVEGIDWQKHLFRTAAMHNHDLSIRGGTDKTKYALSTSLTNQDGIVINSGLNRWTSRFSLEQVINEKLKISTNINYANDKNYGAIASERQTSSSGFASYLIYRLLGYRPVSTGTDLLNLLVDDEDSWALSLVNPVISTQNEIRQQGKSDLYMNLRAVYNLSKGLVLNVRGAYTNRLTRNEAFYNSQTYIGFPRASNLSGAQGSQSDNQYSSWLNENTLSYRKAKRGNVWDFLGGVTIQGAKSETYGFTTTLVQNEELGLRALALGTPTNAIATASKDILASFLGRVNYNIQSKYLFTASFRADGSSKFTTGNRWGYFPSGAFAWNMGKEDFFNYSNIVSDAKLRLSYGVTGNNRIGAFDRFQLVGFTDYYSFANQTPEYAAWLSNMGNQDLKWEKTAQLDIGYDVSFLSNRINLTIDAYNKITSDLLLNSSVPLSTGFNTVYKNIGKIRNRGLEITLNIINVKSKVFEWTSDFNISFNDNKVLELADDQTSLLSAVNWTGDYQTSYLYLAKLGGSASDFYGYVRNGNYQYEDFDVQENGSYVLKQSIPTNGNTASVIQPGDIKYVDQNGDGVVNEKDMVVIGRGLPIHYGGFNNNFSYKGFSVNVFFQWRYGNDILNANRLVFEGNFENRPNLNQFATYANRWTPDNQNNDYFRIGGFGPKGRYSTTVLEDGSFLRLKTVQISYNFPERCTGPFKSVEVYAAGQNLYTWTKYTGYDPEVSTYHSILTPGFDYSAYPRSRTITLGLKIIL